MLQTIILIALWHLNLQNTEILHNIEHFFLLGIGILCVYASRLRIWGLREIVGIWLGSMYLTCRFLPQKRHSI